jgi:transporter family-2 protein
MVWAFLIVAVIGGIAITLQGQFMGTLTEKVGLIESVFITYVTGGILIALAMPFVRPNNLGAWREVPWYTLTTGLLGLVIVGVIGYAVSKLGVSVALLAIIVAQLVFAALIDHYGLFGAEVRAFDLTRTGGLLLVLGGTWLVVR